GTSSASCSACSVSCAVGGAPPGGGAAGTSSCAAGAAASGGGGAAGGAGAAASGGGGAAGGGPRARGPPPPPPRPPPRPPPPGPARLVVPLRGVPLDVLRLARSGGRGCGPSRSGRRRLRSGRRRCLRPRRGLGVHPGRGRLVVPHPAVTLDVLRLGSRRRGSR